MIELTNFIAGPFCGMLLADMGADVIKIEHPRGGDYNRGTGPFPEGSPDGAGFLRLNRNKRSATLDLKQPAGRQAFLAVLRSTDVVIENFRPGTLDDLGIGYGTLTEHAPNVILISLSGFGQTGRDRGRPGLDLIAQAEGGLMSVTGPEDGTPVKVGVPIADLAAGMYAAYAVVSALRLRDKTGRGTFVDVALVEAALSLAVWESSVYWTTGEIPAPLGSAHRVDAPYEAFRTSDGYVTIGANTPSTWNSFLRCTGLEELAIDEWSTSTKRRARRRELKAIIEQTTTRRSTEDWFRSLTAAGVPCGRIRRFNEVLNDPELKERGMIVDLPHSLLGSVRSVGSPLHFGAFRPILLAAAPLLGEHTREVLCAAGYDSDAIAELMLVGIASEPNRGTGRSESAAVATSHSTRTSVPESRSQPGQQKHRK